MAREPAVDAIEQCHEQAEGGGAYGCGRPIRLADEAHHQGDEHGARGGDLVGGSKAPERMIPAQQSNRDQHDDGDRRGNQKYELIADSK